MCMPYMARRKKLLKDAARRLGVAIDKLEWVDGELRFKKTSARVSGVPAVPREERPPKPPPSWRERYEGA